MFRINIFMTCRSSAIISFKVGSFSCHLISSHRSFSWMFSLHHIASHVGGVCVIPSHFMSFHVVSSQRISSHLMSSLLPHLLSADHNCSHLFSYHLNSSLLSSSQLLHSTPILRSLSQLRSSVFSVLHRSSHVRSPQLIPSHLTLSVSQLFLNFLALLNFSQLFSVPRSSSYVSLSLLSSSDIL